MSLLYTIKNKIKNISIILGFYRTARWVSRQVQPSLMREFQGDIKLYRSLIQPSSLCFDVGANVGKKSEALLKAGARVVAFEPNPLVLPELHARCEHYNKWSVIMAALGSGAAISELHACKSHGQTSLDGEWARDVIATYHVPVVTLDSAIKCFGKPAFCKIDVEGWELEVLKGLSQPIPLLSFEFHLGSGEVEKALACLEKITEFGDGLVNITPAESSSFHFKEWMPLREFIKWFPGDLEQTLPGDHYGDIFIKNDHL